MAFRESGRAIRHCLYSRDFITKPQTVKLPSNVKGCLNNVENVRTHYQIREIKLEGYRALVIEI